MNRRIFLLILVTLCLIFGLCSCSCSTDEGEHNHNHNTQSSVPSSTSNSTRPDNQNPTPPNTDIKCEHYWYNVEIDKNTSSTSSVYLKGRCYLCGDELLREAITTVSLSEWKNALSSENLKSFTVFNGHTYSNYDEKSSSSWKIENDIFTEDYFINSNKNSSSYLTDKYSGYSLMYSKFTYNMESRTYVYTIDESSSIELGFADGQLISHSSTSKNGENTKKSDTLYLNHNKINVSIPDYFFDIFNKMIAEENLTSTSLSSNMRKDLAEFLKTLTFDGSIEISFLENGGLSVYFYYENSKTDPIFNEQYSSITIVGKDEKIKSITIGNYSLVF
ncbi:MAG: hypothetical protein E7596_02285 [Ruminococcaceae bacterium]|nr:hypothetical protein [Oscillospiraceae bacterium]